jgi:hypothetical protein
MKLRAAIQKAGLKTCATAVAAFSVVAQDFSPAFSVVAQDFSPALFVLSWLHLSLERCESL